MSTTRRSNVAAGTANDMNGLKFEDIRSSRGALVTLYGSTAVAGGLMSYAIDSEDFMIDASVNIEISADVVDKQRDLLLDREPVPQGKQFVKVDAQICNYLLIVEELPER